MTKDDFKQILIKQYSEVIEELIAESEIIHRADIDFKKLDFRVKFLIKAAKVDGLDERVIWEILEHRLPEYMSFLIDSSTMKIAA